MSTRWRLEILRVRLQKLVRLAVRPSYWPDLRRGVFPGLEHVSVPFRDDYDVVVDAGASRGQFASFARRRWQGSTIYCFEPLPECAETARAVVGDQGDVIEVALGSRSGRQELILSGREDSSSLLPVGELADQVANAGEVGRLMVDVHRLDQHLPEMVGGRALLKIDVQGLELDVLRGAGDLLTAFTDIYCECSFTHLYEGQALASEVISYLASRGFDLVGFDNPARGEDRTLLQADLLFRQSAHRVRSRAALEPVAVPAG